MPAIELFDAQLDNYDIFKISRLGKCFIAQFGATTFTDTDLDSLKAKIDKVRDVMKSKSKHSLI